MYNIAIIAGGHKMGLLGLPENDAGKTVRPAAAAGCEGGYLRNIWVSWDENSLNGRGPIGAAIRTGRAKAVQSWLINDDVFTQGLLCLSAYEAVSDRVTTH